MLQRNGYTKTVNCGILLYCADVVQFKTPVNKNTVIPYISMN